MPKFNGVSEVKDNDTYEQLVKQGSFTGSDGVVYTYDQTGRLYVTDDHVEEELRGYITDLQNKVGSLESGSSSISENKLDKNLGAENSGKLLNVDSTGNITTLDNGIAGQVLTSNGGSQGPIWSNLDLPEQNVVSLTGTQEDPIILYDDIEAGKIYFLSGYIKVVQPATAYSLPDSKPTIMCVGLWLNNEKTIEVRGVQFTSTGVYSQGWNFIQTITFHSSSSWGSNSYLSLNSINGTDTIALNVYAPTVSGTSGQILKSNGSNEAPTWIDLPNSGIEILTGTAESPINFATDMEVNHLYSCSGVFFNTVSSSAQSSISGKTITFQDQGRSFLFYKRNDTSVVCLASSHNTSNQTTSVIIFSAMYGITEITFDSTTGELTNIRSGMGFGRVNGIEGNGNAQALGIYAPIESGTSGQLLQSNGEGAAPTWVTADYVSSAELETKLDINQGTENANKLLNVGSDGNISFIDNNYITSSVNNLDNYYLKTETYTREEINNQINTIRTGLFKPVDVLPDVGEEGYIYLVSNSNSQGDISTQAETENVKDEYIWIAADNKYEYIGSTSVDLTNYYTKDEAAAKTDIPTEYLVEAFNGYYTASDKKRYSGIKITNNTNKSYGVYFDPDDFDASVTGSIFGTGYDYRLYTLKDVVRTTDTDQEIAGIKNYTGGLQKNSVDVATVNDIPQAVTVTLTETQNFNDIVISNEQFELLLSNPENYLIIETSNGSLTISLKYRRSQYFTMTSGNILQEALIFNCVNPTSFAPYAERIDSMTLIRQTQNGETNIVVQDDTLDFTTFVPKTRTINGKSLSNDITLTATDVNALPDTTEIPSTLADLTDDSTHRTVTDTEKSTWNAKSDFSGSYNDLTDKPDISPNLYDLIITSQTEFESFCSSINNSTCTAASVLFIGDGGDLEFTKSDGTGIQLPTTLKIISGINNAIINLGSISTNGLYYETRPTSNDYSINNITIRCSSSTAGNDAVISNCINLTNVTALSIGSVATLCPSAFKNCYYLNYCIANGAAMSAYDNCRYLHDCRGTSTGSYASSDTYSFCTYLDGCYGDSNASTYYYCTNLVGCRSNSGYRGFYNCKQVKSCSSTASYRSYDDCYNLYDCEANRSSSTSTTWRGFENCDRNVFPHFPFGGTLDINKLFTGTVNNTIFIDNDSLYKFYDSTGTQQTIASLNDIPEVPSLTNYVTTNTSQTITAVKYFDGLIHFLGETNNLDNITSQNRGITISSFAGGISTAPTTDSSGIVINYYVSNTYRTQLVLMNDEQASTWRRSYINGNWTAWKQISGNSVDIGSCTLSYSSTNSALEFNFD